MRTKFAHNVLSELLAKGSLHRDHRLLAVCAGPAERDLFKGLNFQAVTVTSLDPVVTSGTMAPFSGQLADVRNLPYRDAEFDFVFVSDGLHHCDSPHRALLEMYRVASKGVIVIESRDNMIMNTAVRFGLTGVYEIGAVIGNGGTCGGVNYTSIPNYVYRWTEREFEKTICCADPTGQPVFDYFYGFNPPLRDYKGVKKVFFQIAISLAAAAARLFPKQSNSFCLVALKPPKLFDWLEKGSGGIRFRHNNLDVK